MTLPRLRRGLHLEHAESPLRPGASRRVPSRIDYLDRRRVHGLVAPIAGYDAIVRQTRTAHLTFDRIPVDDKQVQRVNIRFPVFDDEESWQ